MENTSKSNVMAGLIILSSYIDEHTSSESLGKYFNVGNPWMLISATSLAVESILAMTISSESLNFSPS